MKRDYSAARNAEPQKTPCGRQSRAGRCAPKRINIIKTSKDATRVPCRNTWKKCKRCQDHTIPAIDNRAMEDLQAAKYFQWRRAPAVQTLPPAASGFCPRCAAQAQPPEPTVPPVACARVCRFGRRWTRSTISGGWCTCVRATHLGHRWTWKLSTRSGFLIRS